MRVFALTPQITGLDGGEGGFEPLVPFRGAVKYSGAASKEFELTMPDVRGELLISPKNSTIHHKQSGNP